MRVIKCRGFEQAYKKGVEYVLKNGVDVTVHGTVVRQADEITLDIDIKDLGEPRYDLGPLGEKSNISYCEEFISPSNHHGFIYTYGERMAQCNQLDYVTKLLKKDPSSRQAVISLWIPALDQGQESPPCVNHIHVYKNTKGTFTIHVTMRSNDFYAALYSNFLGVYTLIKYIASEIGPITNYVHTANCPHIYAYYLEDAKKLMEQ